MTDYRSCLNCHNTPICTIRLSFKMAIGGVGVFARYTNYASMPKGFKDKIKKKLGGGQTMLLIENEEEVYAVIGRNCQQYRELPAHKRLRDKEASG